MKNFPPLLGVPDGLRTFWRQLGLILVVLTCAGPVRADSVINSVHNLSASGPGTIKSASQNNPCIFCHTVHKANGVTPLWNHSMSSVSNYVVYTSSRLQSLNITIPQPSGSSRLCLSCHDGTVALGSISTSVMPVSVTQNGATITTMPVGDPANLGTDLSSDHPISMNYDLCAQADSTLQPRLGLNPAVKLELLNGEYDVQCTSCHNPHDNQFNNFLVMNNSGSALCAVCHQPGQWTTSAHAISPLPVPQSIVARFAKKSGASSKAALSAKAMGASIQAMGCETCHMNHKSGSSKHLLQSAVPEQNCLNCHDGVTVKKNIASDFQKISIHPITLNPRAHSPLEDPINPKERHVVCADCHDAHAANATVAAVPNASGALAGVTGVTAAGGVIKPLLKEYELCYRCHADSVARGPAAVTRQFPETNTRLQFSSANQSFHPVEMPGKNPAGVPSLITPWTRNSLMYCTDCHNSDTGPKAGGAGANGPHGSIYRPILERNLTLVDNQPESTVAYALCYKCHDRNVVLSGRSFPLHNSHVVKDMAACTTCHDSHGVATVPHLINFNTSYVTPNSQGLLGYISTGTFKGTCNLMCHGVDHKNSAY
ncbi:MAG: cytochrome c3 family protein [Verrucomicrobiae bacterium]|nr:cytochrome c3 family protein [Verrucomicrobiae bacterium]